MLEIGVIADDLTGGAEAGAAFLMAYSDVLLVDADYLREFSTQSVPLVLAANTNSRSLAPAKAAHYVELVAKQFGALRPDRAFKKVDSCLRGNIGAEVDAVVDTMHLPVSFIAPSYPEMGRITVGDIHYVNGQPVAESGIGQNANERVADSRLTVAVAGQSRHPVGHISIETLAAEEAVLRSAVERLVAGGIRHVTFDAVERCHLASVVKLALKHFPRALLVGSAGLAAALCAELTRPPAPAASISAAVGHHLLALGTASARARRQVVALRKDHPVKTVTFDPVRLGCQASKAADCEKLVAAMACGDVVARIASPRENDWSVMAQLVVHGFAELIAAAVNRARPASLFLSGGDTAFSVLQRLGIHQLKVQRMIMSGLVLSTAVGTQFSGMPIGTKPGAFGDDNALVRWRRLFA